MPLNDYQIDCLDKAFLPLCAGGKIDQTVFSAFLTILRHGEVDQPTETIRRWVDHCKQIVAEQVPIPIEQCGFLEIDLTMPYTEMPLEASFHLVWTNVRRDESISGMAGCRLVMMELLGEPRQRELIGEWNREGQAPQAHAVEPPHAPPRATPDALEDPFVKEVCKRIPDLGGLSSVIFDEANGSAKRGGFQPDSPRKWSFLPDRFIHIEIRPRKKRIDLFLYGKPERFIGLTSVVIHLGAGEFCRCEITHFEQLDDVVKCVWTAWNNYSNR